MERRARPTIRCLLEDLVDTIEDGGQRSAIKSQDLRDVAFNLEDIKHPVLVKATELVSGRTLAELHSSEIKAVHDPKFYKAKILQWRGAVWLDQEDGDTPWLCAAGMRRDGDSADFYETFAEVCARDPERFLPTADDVRRLKLDRVRAADDNRLHFIRAQVVAVVLSAADEGGIKEARLPVSLDPDTLEFTGEATIAVEILEGDEASPGALMLSIKMANYAYGGYDDVLVEVQSALPGLVGGDWDVVPATAGHADPCWWTFVDTSWMSRYRQAVETRGIDEFVVKPPDLTEGSDGFAHIVEGSTLADALVHGKLIRALCRHAFVPSHNPDNRPMCPSCAQIAAECERILNHTAHPPDD